MSRLLIVLCLVFLFQKGTDVLNYLKEEQLERMCGVIGQNSQSKTQKRKVEMMVLISVMLVMDPSLMPIWLLLVIAIYKLRYFQVKRQYLRLKKQLSFEFPIWLRLIQGLLPYNTVVRSLVLSVDFAPVLIQEPLRQLIVRLEADPLQLSHYEAFMKEFEDTQIERAMKHLYRYNFAGFVDAGRQLDQMVKSTSKWLRITRRERNETAMGAYQWLGIVPMVSVTIIFIVLMFQVIVSTMERGWLA